MLKRSSTSNSESTITTSIRTRSFPEGTSSSSATNSNNNNTKNPVLSNVVLVSLILSYFVKSSSEALSLMRVNNAFLDAIATPYAVECWRNIAGIPPSWIGQDRLESDLVKACLIPEHARWFIEIVLQLKLIQDINEVFHPRKPSGGLQSSSFSLYYRQPVRQPVRVHESVMTNACKAGDLDVVKMLLQYGANPHASDNRFPKGPVSLWFATQYENYKVARFLISKFGVDIASTLIHACEEGDQNYKAVKFLLQAQEEGGLSDDENEDDFSEDDENRQENDDDDGDEQTTATSFSSSSWKKTKFSNNKNSETFDINCLRCGKGTNKIQLLRHACVEGDGKIAYYLFKFGCNVVIGGENSRVYECSVNFSGPLFTAARVGGCAKFLRAVLNVSTNMEEGGENYEQELIDEISSSSDDDDDDDETNEEEQESSASSTSKKQKKQQKMFKFNKDVLIKRRISQFLNPESNFASTKDLLEARDQDGQTLLMMAVRSCDPATVRVVCEATTRSGADINMFDNFGRTPLMESCSISSPPIPCEIVKIILEHGGDPNKMRENENNDKIDNKNCLMFATNAHTLFERNIEIVRLLLEKGGADVSYRSPKNKGAGGETALSAAIQAKKPSETNKQIIFLLLEKPKCACSEREIEYAKYRGDEEILKRVLEVAARNKKN